MNNSSGHWDRREFLRGAALAGTAGLVGLRSDRALAEPPPETKRIRLLNRPTLCEAPQYVAEELLQGEGFRDIQYIKKGIGREEDALASGEADITMLFGPPMGLRVDAGDPVVFLAGVHIGCVEIFASERVRTIRDLKGKTFAIAGSRDATYVLIATMAAHVGLNPETDIIWAIHPFGAWPQLLAEGKVDGFLGFPPLAQEARAKKIGHVILNTPKEFPRRPYSTQSQATSAHAKGENPSPHRQSADGFRRGDRLKTQGSLAQPATKTGPLVPLRGVAYSGR